MTFLRYKCRIVPMVARNSIAATKIMRLGPAGFTGTVEFVSVVKAGVLSCTFAIAASLRVFMAV